MGSSDAASSGKRSDDGASAERGEDVAVGDPADSSPGSDELESCRAYLLLVANRELEPRLRGKVAPSDVVQETFVNAHENLSGFRGRTRDELLGWLRRILLNRLTDVRRRYYDAEKRAIDREQRIEADSRVDQPAREVAAGDRSPRATIIAREEVRVMNQALERLPEDFREVITARSLEQLSFAEVGKRMARSENAARKLWSRAVVQLQKELSALDDDTTK